MTHLKPEEVQVLVNAYRALALAARLFRWIDNELASLILGVRVFEGVTAAELSRAALDADWTDALIEHTKRGGHVYLRPDGFVVVSRPFVDAETALRARDEIDRLAGQATK